MKGERKRNQPCKEQEVQAGAPREAKYNHEQFCARRPGELSAAYITILFSLVEMALYT